MRRKVITAATGLSVAVPATALFAIWQTSWQWLATCGVMLGCVIVLWVILDVQKGDW